MKATELTDNDLADRLLNMCYLEEIRELQEHLVTTMRDARELEATSAELLRLLELALPYVALRHLALDIKDAIAQAKAAP